MAGPGKSTAWRGNGWARPGADAAARARVGPMRLLFVDRVPWDYTPDTPYAHPLGGSQSALCYLAERLAAMGHEVGLLNNARDRGVVRGVHCFNVDGTSSAFVDFVAKTDAVVAINDVDPLNVQALRARGGGARGGRRRS